MPISCRNTGLPLKRGYAGVYRQVSSKGSTGLLGGGSRAARMWQLANYAAKNLAIFQLPFRILSDVLETVEQDVDDSQEIFFAAPSSEKKKWSDTRASSCCVH